MPNLGDRLQNRQGEDFIFDGRHWVRATGPAITATNTTTYGLDSFPNATIPPIRAYQPPSGVSRRMRDFILRREAERDNPLQVQNEPTFYGDEPDMPKIRQDWLNQTVLNFNKQLTPKDGEIGLELEVEGDRLFDMPLAFWSCHTDGSLRASNIGGQPVEYVLKHPLIRSECYKALNYLDKKLKMANSSINMSTRTSVHVHLNCQALTYRQVFTLICLYLIFEELLLEFSGETRVGNLFCLSAKESQHFLLSLADAARTGNVSRIQNESYRYTSCNTASLSKFGSLEFRSMRGTVDMALVRLWVDVLCRLKDQSLVYGNPIEVAADYKRLGSEAFLLKTFGDFSHIFEGLEDVSTKMHEGLMLMQDIAFASDWANKKKVDDE